MSDWTQDKGGAGGSTSEMPSGSDYRMRELEARLERRLEAIESERRRGRWMRGVGNAAFLAMLGAATLALWTATPRDGAWTVESVSAEEVVLRDADGIARGRMATDDGRAQLTLSDQDGRERIRLTVLADGSPGVTISDPDARPRAVLGYLPDGTTNLVFADAQGISRAVFGLDADGSTQALFADRSGMIRALVGVGADGDPSVSTFEGADESAP